MGEILWNAGGVRTYYEVYGEGEPLVLLHGGLATTESWAMQVPTLAQRYVSTCPNVAATGAPPTLLDRNLRADGRRHRSVPRGRGYRTAHLLGSSDGAVVGMLVALRRPELVRKLVVIGQYFNFDGEVPEFRAMLEYWGTSLPEAMHEVYDRVSPDGPEHFPVVLEKMMRMWREEPDIALSELAGVRAPVLLMQGDDDIVKVEHSATLAATLSEAQLAVIPGSSHMAPLEKPDLVNRLILDFLSDHQPEKVMSLRG